MSLTISVLKAPYKNIYFFSISKYYTHVTTVFKGKLKTEININNEEAQMWFSKGSLTK